MKFSEHFNPEYILKIIKKDYIKFFSIDEYVPSGEAFFDEYLYEMNEMIDNMKYCKTYRYTDRDYTVLLKDEFVRNLGFNEPNNFSETYSVFHSNGQHVTEPWHDIVWSAWLMQLREMEENK